MTDLRSKGQQDAQKIRAGGSTAKTVGKRAAKATGRGAAATGRRVSLATRVGIFDFLTEPRKAFWLFGRKRKRRFVSTLLFGTRGPKGMPKIRKPPSSFTIRIGGPAQKGPSKAAQRKGGRVSAATQNRKGGKFAGTPGVKKGGEKW